jgi:hypothetical protein
MGNCHPISMKIGTQTRKKHAEFKNSQYRKCRPNFKMAAATMFEIKVNAIK